MSNFKNLFLLVSFLSCLNINAQNSISAYGFLSLAETKALSSNEGKWPLLLIKSSEVRTSVSGGVNFQHEIKTNGLSYSIGLEWIDAGYKRSNFLTFGDQIDDRLGFIYTTNEIPKNFRFIYRFHYISMPLLIMYNKDSKNEKWNYSAGIGGSPDIFIQQNIIAKVKIDDENQRRQYSTNDEVFQDLVLSFRSELGIERNLSDKFSLFGLLAYRMGITNHAKEKENDFRSSNYGIKIGLSFLVGNKN